MEYIPVDLYALHLLVFSFPLTATTDSTFLSKMDSTLLSHPPSDAGAQTKNANFAAPASIDTLHTDQEPRIDTEDENMTPLPRAKHSRPNAVSPNIPARKRAQVADHAGIAIDVVAQRPVIAVSEGTMAVLADLPMSDWEKEIVGHGSEHCNALTPVLGPAGGDAEAAPDFAHCNQLRDSTCFPMRERPCDLEHAAEVTQGVRTPAVDTDNVPEVGTPRAPVHVTWPSMALCRVPEKLLQEFAFFNMSRVPTQMRAFNKAFEQGIGLSHVPGRGAIGQLQPVAIAGIQNAQCIETQGRQKDTRNDKSPRHARLAAGAIVDLPRPVCDKQPAECRSLDGTPRTYVAKLLAERAQDPKKPMKLQEKQLEVLAAVVSQLENMLAADQNGADVKQEVLLLMGPAGSGKKELIKITAKVVRHFFGVDAFIAMASSTAAARNIDGDTIHSSLNIWGQQKLNTADLRKRVTKESKDRWRSVRALVIDEVGLCPPALFGAASFKACLLRPTGNTEGFAMPGSAFGGIQLVILAADFLKPCPMANLGRGVNQGIRRVSLLQTPQPTVPAEHQDGVRCFRKIVTSVLELKNTYSFCDEEPKVKCEIMPTLLEYMRDPQGKSIPDYLWQALLDCQVDGRSDPRLHRRQTVEGFEVALTWEAVGRLMQYRIVRDAANDGEMVFYIQAIDQPKDKTLSKAEWVQLLSEMSLGRTKSMRMTFLGIFKGMRVRLLAKISARGQLMQDAVGVVVAIEFHDDEFECRRSDWPENQEHPAWQRGYVYLKHMPKSVHVQFDTCTVDVGLGLGVVPVEPSKVEWFFKTHTMSEKGERKPQQIRVTRHQIALLPEKVRTAQSGQEMSMGALTAMLTKNFTMSDDEWWLHLYVILSQAKHIGHLLLYGLPPRHMFERGPPSWLADGLKELEPKLYSTEKRAATLLRDFDSFRVRATTRLCAGDAVGVAAQEAYLPNQTQRLNGKPDVSHEIGVVSKGNDDVCPQATGTAYLGLGDEEEIATPDVSDDELHKLFERAHKANIAMHEHTFASGATAIS